MILHDHGLLQARHQVGRLLYYVFVGVRFVNEPHPYIMVRYKRKGSLTQGVRVARTQTEITAIVDALVQEHAQ